MFEALLSPKWGLIIHAALLGLNLFCGVYGLWQFTGGWRFMAGLSMFFVGMLTAQLPGRIWAYWRWRAACDAAEAALLGFRRRTERDNVPTVRVWRNPYDDGVY